MDLVTKMVKPIRNEIALTLLSKLHITLKRDDCLMFSGEQICVQHTLGVGHR